MNVLIIDNYDSFTFNLYQYVGEILHTELSQAPGNPKVSVKRNNEVTLEDIKSQNYDRIIISPGPGSPEDPAYFGVCSEVIKELGPSIPLLGVCLGMQGIAHVFGGDVVRAGVPMHGKTSPIRHDGQGVYKGLPQDIEIMRYHSLMVKADTLPECLEVTAVVSNEQFENDSLIDCVNKGEEIMGIRHKQFPIQGVQFHPESFATEGAKRLLANFLMQV
ncbi:anthranilate synthase component II [Psychrobacter sanguinis]|uniref:anthranilate synthase component II n=1 Tax=Psychrobacter sanguinis TaxID=861445 RepID=UPI00191AB165|nr:aminodeoxychorismate/anthranilate synthase component II [Psychrobacter sanguinis]MCC3307788.1 aminodeoxychorismate/anthranilate synthase component II [Psychrobacter sanguinis]UEC25085.1 aminodeoxychorismate/anthranilate synthase component II [Psychrobacter sanguinis]